MVCIRGMGTVGLKVPTDFINCEMSIIIMVNFVAL